MGQTQRARRRAKEEAGKAPVKVLLAEAATEEEFARYRARLTEHLEARKAALTARLERRQSLGRRRGKRA